jgi:uncharacterized protein
MGRFIVWCGERPFAVILVVVVLSAFWGYGTKDLRLDPSFQDMMLEDAPQKAHYREALDHFGSDNTTVVFIKDPALFTHAKLSAAEEAFYRLQDIPDVVRVDGLFNASNFQGEDGGLITGPLLDWIPQDEGELARLVADARRNPLLDGTLIGGAAPVLAFTLISEPSDDKANIRIAGAIDEVVADLAGQVEEVFHVGVPMIHQSIDATIRQDMALLMPLCLAVVLATFVVGLGSVNGALLPALTGGLATLWTLGFMGWIGIPLNILTWFVPCLIFIVGSTEDMHLLAEFRAGLAAGLDRRQAVARMARHTGPAAALTGLTTFLGFASIAVNEIPMLRQLGIAAAFALLVNPLITFLVAPVYLRYVGGRSPRPAAGAKLARVAAALGRTVEARGVWIVGLAAVAVALGCIGVLQVKVDNDPIAYFKEDSSVRRYSQRLHTELAGMQNFLIVFEGGQPRAFKEAGALRLLADIQQHIAESGHFDASTSAADFVALAHREISGGAAKDYAVPADDDLIAQYLLFFGRHDLERYVTADWSGACIRVRHNISSSHQLERVLDELGLFIEGRSGGMVFHITGESILINRASASMVEGQIYSLGLIMVFIFAVISLLFVRFKAGLLALLPNGIPVVFLFGVMGFCGLTLNPGTAMIAACALGIAVDDTIHLFVRYNGGLKRSGDTGQALGETIAAELRPVLTTTCGLALGFAVLGFSDFVPTLQFGLLSALVMGCAFVADLLITPVLLSRTPLITVWDLLGLKLREEVVKHSDIFWEMSPLQIRKIILLGRLEEVEGDSYVLRQGETGHTMYLILEGAIRIERDRAEGGALVLVQLGPGDIFGEIALVRQAARTADAVATGQTRLLAIDWNDLERIRKFYPRIATRFFLNISRILGVRLAQANDRQTGG